MKTITLAKQVAGRLGVYATASAKWGLDLWTDVGRIRPWTEYRTIFDIGGNHGQSAIVFAERAPHASIVSFEPHPENIPIINAVVAPYDHVRVVESLVGNTPGASPMYHWRSNGMYAMHDDPNDPGCPMVFNIPVVTLDQWCNAHGVSHIDFLKTDTESHDVEVLQGAERLLRAGAIDTIVSEFGTEETDTEHTNLFDLVAYLRPFGYRLIWIYEPDIRPAEKGVPGWHIDYGNVLFTRL